MRDAEIVMSPVADAEVSIGFDCIEEIDSALPRDAFARSPLPWAPAFLAGQCLTLIAPSSEGDRP